MAISIKELFRINIFNTIYLNIRYLGIWGGKMSYLHI